MKQGLPWTRRISRAVFAGLAVWLILGVPFVIASDQDIRAVLSKHDWSSYLFRALVFDVAKGFGLGCIFLILALLLSRTSVQGYSLA